MSICNFSYFPFSFRGQDFGSDCTSSLSLFIFTFEHFFFPQSLVEDMEKFWLCQWRGLLTPRQYSERRCEQLVRDIQRHTKIQVEPCHAEVRSTIVPLIFDTCKNVTFFLTEMLRLIHAYCVV